jgi:integrase
VRAHRSRRSTRRCPGRADRGEYLLESNRHTRYNDQSLSRLIAEACEGMGFPCYSPHGLRHLAGASLAEADCSVHEIMSVLGHVTEDEAMHYVKQANRKRWRRRRRRNGTPSEQQVTNPLSVL